MRNENVKYGTNMGHLRNMKPRQGNISGVCGVTWTKNDNKWRAQLDFRGEKHYLGQFEHLADAIAARKAAELKYVAPFLEEYGIELSDDELMKEKNEH